MSIEIKPHPYKIVCDICSSRDTFMVSKTGVPASQCPTLCRNDLKEIVLASMEYFKNEITLPVPDDYERLKAENERFGNELEACEVEVKRLTVLLESDKQNKVQADAQDDGQTEIPANDGAGENDDLEKMSKQELYAIAKELGVAGRYTTMNKAELIEKIREAQKK